MMARLARGLPRLLWLSLMALCLVPLAEVTPAAAQTAEPPSLEVFSVHHDPAGTLSVGVRADGGRGTRIQSLTMYVDDVPVILDVDDRDVVEELATLLVIDTSASMEGIPMSAARDAARELIGRLPEGDRVGLVSFASTAIVEHELTADVDAVLGAVGGLQAIGSTALYDALTTGVSLLEPAPEASRVLVLMADGEDNASAATAEESLARAVASGVQVHTVGVGDEIDVEYLETLAADTGGEFFRVIDSSDAGALTSLFARLGGELGSNEVHTIPLRALSHGEHQLSVRGVVNEVPVSVRTTFDVTNEGLLRPVVEPPTAPDGPIAIRFEGLAERPEVAIEAQVEGVTFRPDSGATEVLVDPWRLAPGTYEVEVTALASAGIAARETVTVEVPALEPLLTVTDRDGEVVIRGRVQGVERPAIVARAGDVEIGRTASGELVIAAPDAPLVVELLWPSGEVLATQDIEAGILAPGGSGSLRSTLLWLAAVGALGVFAWRWLARRRNAAPREPEPPPLRRRPLPSPGDGSSPARPASAFIERLGTIVVRDPEGGQHTVALTRRPLTIGRDSRCDIVIDTPEVRPEHARLTALSAHEVQIHALADRGPRPYDGAQEHEWLIVRSGEQIAFGEHYLQVLMGDDTQQGDGAQAFAAEAEAGS